jgi:hypothetical protein
MWNRRLSAKAARGCSGSVPSSSTLVVSVLQSETQDDSALETASAQRPFGWPVRKPYDSRFPSDVRSDRSLS